jgi:hypothetical protein
MMRVSLARVRTEIRAQGHARGGGAGLVARCSNGANATRYSQLLAMVDLDGHMDMEDQDILRLSSLDIIIH